MAVVTTWDTDEQSRWLWNTEGDYLYWRPYARALVEEEGAEAAQEEIAEQLEANGVAHDTIAASDVDWDYLANEWIQAAQEEIADEARQEAAGA